MKPNPYVFIVLFGGVAVIFPLLPLGLAWLWRRFFQPPKPGLQKNATYECGMESLGEAQVQFRSSTSLLHHFSDLRRRGDFPGSFCRFLQRTAARSIHRHPGFSFSAHRRPRLGMEQGMSGMGKVMERSSPMTETIDQGLQSELQKQGIWVTSMQDLYNWGRRNSIWPLAVWSRLLRHRNDRDGRVALRPGQIWRRSFPAIPAAGRPDDRCRDSDEENGSTGS